MKRTLLNALTLTLLCAAVAASFIWLQLDFSSLVTADGREQMARYVAAFFPPNTSPTSAFASTIRCWMAGSIKRGRWRRRGPPRSGLKY